MPSHPKTITLDSFRGLNNVLPPERTEPEFLKEALNIDIDKSGGMKKRKGYTKLVSGDFHSLYSDGLNAFAVKDNDLVRITTGHEIITLKSNVGTDIIRFDIVDGEYYFTSDSVNGIIKNDVVRSWGIPRPNPQPKLSVISGNLDKGTYQLSITFVRKDGMESGSGVAQQIILSQSSGIQLTNIPVSSDPNVDKVRIYLSSPDGEILYLEKEITNGTATTLIKSSFNNPVPLKSFNVDIAPLGHLVKYHYGRMYIAQDNILWYSEPFSYEWFKYQSSYFVFDERIRAIMPTQDGMWIAAEKMYYLSGKDPSRLSRTEKEPVRAIEGSEVKIVGAYIFIENTPIGFKWLVTTDRGMYVCYNDGVILNLTEKNVSFPLADRGTGVFIQDEGINRYLSLLQKKDNSNNTVVGDIVTSTVIRNGVIVCD